ncbi:MAG: hypothetical protein A3I39_02430 [Candidatus Yanofskybacteria bacterium RIFCSPLOWO2_02_FULL_47_9b]|uniref:Uncharacterized protein n=1 Tax=Candidatus Yanofskybacteria bacterium RIFCSPLOWO2_02_FULL_47_9b TaxID=1802708 RepID=A0A1F8H754_9BACT|nr:MAG: hypothetical protein A3I39_02430 [Candidatus Yanofskybacteria bacterium RIFCSPLOWO2_02_FULL_47_9b]
MLRNIKIIIITVLVTLSGALGILEWRRSVVRADALTELNYNWSGYKTEKAKTEAVIKANAVIEQNRSFFDFSNSGASEDEMLIRQNQKTGQWELVR